MYCNYNTDGRSLLTPRAPPYRYIYRPASSRCALARVYLLPVGISLTGESLFQAPSYGRMFLTVPAFLTGWKEGAFDRRPFLRASIFWTVLLFHFFFPRQHHLQTFQVPSKNLVAVVNYVRSPGADRAMKSSLFCDVMVCASLVLKRTLTLKILGNIS